MDISAIVLNKLLLERNLDIWAKLKLAFLDSAYSTTYSSISRYYDKYGVIPSFEELELVIREPLGHKTLASLKLIDEPDISGEVALDALLDQYTQNETIAALDKFVDKLPQYDTQEIKESLSNIVLKLDEKTLTTEGVYTMADIMLFKSADDLERDRTHLGLNNTFDATLSGVAVEELILIGGQRGAGKSITSSNIIANQYESGNSAVIFSIEMIAHEVHERNFAILADVPYMQLKQGTLGADDMMKIIKTRAGMFLDADDLVHEYSRHRDRFKFEAQLVREKELKPDNQLIIIDDRALSLTSIDLHLGKLKARFGEKLKVCVVDYLNQIVVEEGKSQFDWQPQIVVSKKLKELARKHKVVMVSPYQIDATGEARFAKGILDAADIALIMEPHDKGEGAVSFNTTKIRGGPPLNFTSAINWDTLRISPIPIEKPEKKEKGEKKVSIKRA
jgi:replicative DNA helicase